MPTSFQRFARGVLLTGVALLIASGLRTAQADVIINNNVGATGTSNFTQSESSFLVFGSTVFGAFNDAGSNSGGAPRFTGTARSSDGGLTWSDLGSLPSGIGGDAGDPVLARNTTTGAIYLATLGFNTGGIQFFRSTDTGFTWSSPVNATGATTGNDRNNMTVDNFAGSQQGNIYLAARRFDAGNGIFLFRSTDTGFTWAQTGQVASGVANNVQNPWVTVGPDHSVYTFYLNDSASSPSIVMKKSTDGGLTFAAPVTVTNLNPSLGINGDLGLTGIRNGTVTPAGFRSPDTPQAVVNPVTGQIYVVYHDDPAGSDRGDIFLRNSTDGGFTWSAPLRVNTDATLNDQWQPTLAVTPDGTKLGVFWYDRRLDPANNLIDYFGRTCTITGNTLNCGTDYRISDESFLPEFGRDAVITPDYMGDYDIAAADNSFFYVGWGDNLLPLAGGDGRMDPNVFFDRISTANVVVGVPLPSTVFLLCMGLGVLAFVARRALVPARARKV